MMTANPELHRAPLGYGKNGPLTWVAECRVPWRPPSADGLAIAAWMIDHGSDVHQGGDGPLMRAALHGDRVPMMDLLVARGADVNAAWDGTFPIIFAPCESVDPVALKWLLDHGANPNVARFSRIFRDGARLRHRVVRSFATARCLHRCPSECRRATRNTTSRLSWICFVAVSIGFASSLPPTLSSPSPIPRVWILGRLAVAC